MSVFKEGVRKAWFDCILQTAGVIPQVVFFAIIAMFLGNILAISSTQSK